MKQRLTLARARSLLRSCVAAVLLAAHAAAAAPFCVVGQGVPPQCLYADPSDCRVRAAQLNGTCAANPEEFSMPVSAGPYCVTDATRSLTCGYLDLRSCTLAAERRQGSVCIAGPLAR